MSRHTSLPNALNCHILDICLRALVTPATIWASVTLVTGQTKSMGQSEPDIILMSLVLHGEIVTRCNTIPLQHADPGEHSPASRIRHRQARSRSRSYDSVSPRRHSPSTFSSRGKRKKSHKKRNHSSTSISSSRRSSSSSSSESERDRKQHKSKRRRRNTLNHIHPSVIRVRRSTRGRGVLLLLLPLCLLRFLQTLLLLLGEVQPRGLLLQLVSILNPLLGLRVRRNTGIISVFMRIVMTNLIRIRRMLRT